jgi:hypothetical protein
MSSAVNMSCHGSKAHLGFGRAGIGEGIPMLCDQGCDADELARGKTAHVKSGAEAVGGQNAIGSAGQMRPEGGVAQGLGLRRCDEGCC